MLACIRWLIVLPLTVSLAMAEAPTQEPILEPTQGPALEPILEPTQGPALEPILAPTQGSALAPTQSPIPPARPEPVLTTPPSTLRPKPRPAIVLASAPQAPLLEEPAQPRKGSVCGNPAIKGVALQAIKSRIKGCNLAGPVSVTEIDGVKLVPAATINCNEAQALASWITAGLQPQFNNQVARLLIADSYASRPRNNVPGGKVSEHGSGNAIDISGMVLTTGKVITVASNFRGPLQAAHRAACGTFHTTLGPGSDGYHENHIHLDVAPYRGRPYCR